MAVSDNPFGILYSILHELCVALVMDTVIRQVQALRLGRWKDAIRFELISEGSGGGSTHTSQDGETDSAGLRTPGIKIIYWLDLDKNSSTPDTGTCPFFKIETGPDLQIRCIHSTFVIDPLNGREADFCLDQSCIDVEKLLLRAICCHRYTRLLEIQKELARNVQVFRATDDVFLKSCTRDSEIDDKKNETKSDEREFEAQEVLCVRAYGLSFFTLGINIRNGRFLLRMSQNILPPSALSDCEEALNQGSLSPAEAFVSLRSKSILHLFASIGRFLGLEVYEHGFAAEKVPKTLLDGSATLLMGFADYGSSYFLLLQLDKDFKPIIKLLEIQPDQAIKVHTKNDPNQVMRNIDISQMQLLEDELNLNLLDMDKLSSFLPDAHGCGHISEDNLLSELNLQSTMQITVSPRSVFSSS